MGFTGRQWLEVESVELPALPYLLDCGGNRFAVSNSEDHLCRASLRDLMNNEGGQIIKQMSVVDSHHDAGAGGRGGQRFDHPRTS